YQEKIQEVLSLLQSSVLTQLIRVKKQPDFAARIASELMKKLNVIQKLKNQINQCEEKIRDLHVSIEKQQMSINEAKISALELRDVLKSELSSLFNNRVVNILANYSF